MIDHQAPILITGGTGFAGSHLLKALNQAGYQNLHATCIAQPDNWSLPFPVQLHVVDLTNAEQTNQLIEQIKPLHLYQLASLAAPSKSFEQADSILSNNILLQTHVLEAVRLKSPQTRVLSIGSADAYGYSARDFAQLNESAPFRPLNPYAVSKAAQDMLADTYFLNYQLDIVRVRPFNHIGPGQTEHFVVSAFASQIAKIEKGQQKTIQVGNLDAVRDFSDVRDVIDAYVLLMEKGQAGQVYNIGSGQGWKIAELLDTLVKMSTVPITIETDTSRLRPTEVPQFVADASKLKALGWQPKHQLTQTLSEILTDWRQRV